MFNYIRIFLRLFVYGSLLFLIIVFLAGILYALHLDQIVRSRFDGKRWALPARVYARPLELYVGRNITTENLQEELERLGYSKVAQPHKIGTYSRNKNQFILRTRPFRFWDGDEPARLLDVRFDDKGLAVLKELPSNEDLPIARLDSVLITSIYSTAQEDRVLVRRKELPDSLIKTLLAVEDRQFYNHHGIDPAGILRALWSNLQAGHVVQGGSTLTQQLVKNFYLTNERSLLRKINEAIMALTLDLRYSKDQILEAYANEIYLCQDGSRAIHGFGLASRFLFNQELADLDLPRIALLVGIIKGPSKYNPKRHPEAAYIRRNVVLDTLLEQGIINLTQANQAKQTELGVSSVKDRKIGRYPAFLELMRNQLKRDYREEDLRSEGLRIFTTLDPLIQANAEEGVEKRLSMLEHSNKKLEAAVVVASSDNGEVLAIVGGKKSGYSGFNRALNAVRSIGSLIKPLIYLEALSRPNYTLFSELKDEAVVVEGGIGRKTWKPKNANHREHGIVPLYHALAHSYNLATVNLGLELGIPVVATRLRNFGIQRTIPEVAPLLLGTISLTPFEVTQIYQGIASGGFLTPLRTVREVLDSSGKLLGHYSLEVKEIADPQVVWLLNWALRQVVERGTAKDLFKYLPPELIVAGKTGTTDDNRDSWFAGFTGDKVAVAWVGRDDNFPMGLSGSTGAMPLWADVISSGDNSSWDVSPPAGIVMKWVDALGNLTSDNCAGAYQAPFRVGTVPKKYGVCRNKKIKNTTSKSKFRYKRNKKH